MTPTLRRVRQATLAVAALTVACAHGDGPTTPSDPPPVLSDVAGGWRMLSAGTGQTCGVAVTSGVAYCWGLNDRNQVGDGTATSRARPTPIATDQRFTTVAAGRYESCGVTTDAHVYCWGAFLYGGFRPTPTLIDPGLQVTALAIGRYQACGLRGDGSVVCWSSAPGTPQPVPGGFRFRSIASGADRVCGVAEDGAVYCWADALGSVDISTPPTKQPITQAAMRAASGGLDPTFVDSEHTCALLADASAACWGANYAGQLGTGDTTAHAAATPVNTRLRWTSLAATLGRTCAVAANAGAYCWGFLATSGLLVPQTQPTLAFPSVRAASVTTGEDHTCIVTPGGAGFCSGENGAGQLGGGAAGGTNQPPTRVLDP